MYYAIVYNKLRNEFHKHIFPTMEEMFNFCDELINNKIGASIGYEEDN